MTQMMPHHEAIVAFRGVDQLRFLAPVFIGDTVHVTKKVIDKQSNDGVRGLIFFETTVLNQEGKAVLAYVDRLMVKCRGIQ
jgi:acyl dehydratase